MSEYITPDEWLRNVDHDSKEFRTFIDWCYEHFEHHMKIMARAYSEGDGEIAYQDYLAGLNSPENIRNIQADQQMDRDRDA